MHHELELVLGEAFTRHFRFRALFLRFHHFGDGNGHPGSDILGEPLEASVGIDLLTAVFVFTGAGIGAGGRACSKRNRGAERNQAEQGRKGAAI
jgi:hypothetical protein